MSPHQLLEAKIPARESLKESSLKIGVVQSTVRSKTVTNKHAMAASAAGNFAGRKGSPLKLKYHGITFESSLNSVDSSKVQVSMALALCTILWTCSLSLIPHC